MRVKLDIDRLTKLEARLKDGQEEQPEDDTQVQTAQIQHERFLALMIRCRHFLEICHSCHWTLVSAFTNWLDAKSWFRPVSLHLFKFCRTVGMEGSIAVLLGFALRVSPFGTTAPAPEHILLGVACVLPLLLAGGLLVLDRLAGFVCFASSHAWCTGFV